MKIAFYHYFWPNLLEKQTDEFKNKISEYLVIHNLIDAMEKDGIKIIKYSKTPPLPYQKDSDVRIFRNGLKLIIDLTKFFISPPDFLGLVSKSIYKSNTLIPLLRFICRIRKVKFLIFLGHDESVTSTSIFKNVRPYKYTEDLYWDHPEQLEKLIATNENYRPLSKNEYTILISSVIENNCIEEGWPLDQLFVLPMGTDTDYYKPNYNKLVTENTTKILFAGNGVTRKGLGYAIPAIKKLQRDYNISLSIVSHNIKNLELDNSKIYKDITDDELLGLYQSHDIFILPSLLDGWGLSASEAMACELPVIVSDITGIRDIIKDGKNGLIVKPKSSDEIYTALKTLIDNKSFAKDIGRNARLTTLSYQWSHIGRSFLEFVKKFDAKK